MKKVIICGTSADHVVFRSSNCIRVCVLRERVQEVQRLSVFFAIM